MSFGVRAVAKTRQPRSRSARAEASPMPDEQPVIKIVRWVMACVRPLLTRGRSRQRLDNGRSFGRQMPALAIVIEL